MKIIWIKFHPKDWLSDESLRVCSIEARGLWVDMLCLMAKSEKEGYLLAGSYPINSTDLARIAGISADKCVQLLAELGAKGVYSIKNDTIFSRRMVKDAEERKSCRDRILRWRNANVTQKLQECNATCNGDVTGKRSEVRDQRSEKRERTLVRPTRSDWLAYATEMKWNSRDAESAFDYYESNGWKVGGRAPVKDWRACARNCQRRNQTTNQKGNQTMKPVVRSQCESLPTYKVMGFATHSDWVKAGCP
ncbi:MAG: hypothetical protein EBR82_55280 [Caulobacteraceae bacterium]|nr:hypothetical protein [Caulobacteraceae bacterium]